MTTHAGAVTFHKTGGRTLYLIISSSDGTHWVLPKGHIKPEESSQVAALRELREEAGVVGEIITRLPIQRFGEPEKVLTVQYYLVRKVDTVTPSEKRSLRWEEEYAAVELLSFADARQILHSAAAALRRKESEQ